MNDTSLIVLDLTKSNQQISELIELAHTTYEYKEDLVDKAFLDLHKSFKNGFLSNLIDHLFDDPKVIKRVFSGLFRYYESNKKMLKMIESKKIKDKLSYIHTIIESHDCLEAINKSFIDQNEGLDNKLIELIGVGNELYIGSLTFAVFNLLSEYLKKDSPFIYRDADIKECLYILVYCQKVNKDADELGELLDDAFNFLNDKENLNETNETKFLEMYKAVSKICVDLELKRSELYNDLTSKIKNENN